MSDLLNSASLVMIPSGYKEDIVYSQIPTDGSGDLAFTRASNGTRVNSAGLVEVAPWNFVEYSEQFDNSTWTKQDLTITANDTTAPNGTITADKLTLNATTSAHIFYQAIPNQSNGYYTVSIYAKYGNTRYLGLRNQTGGTVNGYQFFDILNGVVASSTGTTYGASIENVGNGWYKCSLICLSTNNTNVQYNVYSLTTVDGSESCTSNGSLYGYLWGAMVNIGSTAKPYFPTTDRLNVPRLTYQNGGGGCPSLLLEKQSTNVVTYSEQFDNGAWVKSGSNSVTANAIISPDGTQNADFVVSTATNSSAKYVYQVISLIATPTATIYAKAGAVTEMMFYCQGGNGIYFNLTNGAFIAYYGSGSSTITTYSSVAVGNGWYRYSITFNTSVTSIEAYMSVNTNISASIANGDGFYLWGVQLESSSYATSYIPTTSSSATRVVDACYKTGISSLIGQTEGVLFVDVDFKYNNETTDKDTRIWSTWDDSYIKVISIWARDNALRYQVYDAATSLNIENSITASQGRHKVALAYNGTSLIVYMDGSLVINTTMSQSAPATSRAGLAYFWNQNIIHHSIGINQALLFKTALSTTELASLTTI